MSNFDWNPSDKNAGVTLSESNVRATTASGSWIAVRTLLSVDTASSLGRYAEFECVSLSNYCMIGLASASAALTQTHAESGTNFHYNNGTAYPGGSSFGSSWTTGDILMLAVRNGKIYYGKNGTWFNSANFVAETGYAHSGLTGVRHLCMSAYTASMRVFAAVADQTYAAPSGFVGFVKPETLSRTLLDEDLNPLASASFDWAFFEQATVDILEAPVATGTDSTDGSGVLSITVPHTGLISGEVGSLLISNTNGSEITQCRSHFAPIEIP